MFCKRKSIYKITYCVKYTVYKTSLHISYSLYTLYKRGNTIRIPHNTIALNKLQILHLGSLANFFGSHFIHKIISMIASESGVETGSLNCPRHELHGGSWANYLSVTVGQETFVYIFVMDFSIRYLKKRWTA